MHAYYESFIYIYTYVLVDQSCPSLHDPMDCRLPGSSVHGIFRQEHWSGLPMSTSGALPDPGMELMALASPAFVGRLCTTVPPEEPTYMYTNLHICTSICTYIRVLKWSP